MSTQEKIKIEGGCHCGAIEFIAFVSKNVKSINCNCSICAMTAYKHLNVLHSNFELIKGDNDLSEYNFGTAKARHFFCKHCGIKSFYQPRSHPGSYSINLNCCTSLDQLSVEVIDFDGQNWEESVDKIR